MESLNEEFEHIQSLDKLKYEKICLQNERESIQKRIKIIDKKINNKLPNLMSIQHNKKRHNNYRNCTKIRYIAKGMIQEKSSFIQKSLKLEKVHIVNYDIIDDIKIKNEPIYNKEKLMAFITEKRSENEATIMKMLQKKAKIIGESLKIYDKKFTWG